MFQCDFLAVQPSETPLSFTDVALIFYSCVVSVWIFVNIFQLSELVCVIPELC